jgi:hypothetical protein
MPDTNQFEVAIGQDRIGIAVVDQAPPVERFTAFILQFSKHLQQDFSVHVVIRVIAAFMHLNDGGILVVYIFIRMVHGEKAPVLSRTFREDICRKLLGTFNGYCIIEAAICQQISTSLRNAKPEVKILRFTSCLFLFK